MDDYTYLNKYARTDDTWKPSTSPSTVDRARAAIDAIRNRQETSIAQLQSVLSLSAHPESLDLLNNGSLIQDCTLLIYRKQREDPQYPFSYEQGYLYFRILVLAIGFSMAAKDEMVHNTIVKQIREESELEDPTSLVMQLLNGIANEHMNGPSTSPDEFLGWSSRNRVAVITKENALMLLDILWKDRKQFLKAWAVTQAPSLNGLLFIFWRCVRITSTSDQWASLTQIAWRYSLVAEGNDLLTLLHMHRDINRQNGWVFMRMAVDLEDSRNMLRILTARLSPTSPLYSPPTAPSLTHMLWLVVPNIGFIPGVEDLFLPLLRALFNHFWFFMAGEQEDPEFELFPNEVGTVVYPSFIMLEHLVLSLPESAKEFVQTIAELGIIDALARAFTLMKDDSDKDPNFHATPLVRPCTKFINCVQRVGTPTYCHTTFADSFAEWFKALRYMRARDGMFDTRTHQALWYTMTEQCWVKVGEALGYNTQFQRAETLTRGCAYTRCPDPNSAKGVRFECPCDEGIVYCGMRCQQA